jgi:hypothetical protein
VRARICFIVCMTMALLLQLLGGTVGHRGVTPYGAHGRPIWPTSFQGRAIVPLPLSAVEQRFAAQFPGRIGRFSDGRSNIIVRLVDQPTRLLHPAADCFRGIGYRVERAQVRVDNEGQSWSCFKVEKGGQQRMVCERIYDAQGDAWTDVSSWYWAAALGRTQGPWWAVTVARAP